MSGRLEIELEDDFPDFDEMEFDDNVLPVIQTAGPSQSLGQIVIAEGRHDAPRSTEVSLTGFTKFDRPSSAGLAQFHFGRFSIRAPVLDNNVRAKISSKQVSAVTDLVHLDPAERSKTKFHQAASPSIGSPQSSIHEALAFDHIVQKSNVPELSGIDQQTRRLSTPTTISPARHEEQVCSVTRVENPSIGQSIIEVEGRPHIEPALDHEDIVAPSVLHQPEHGDSDIGMDSGPLDSDEHEVIDPTENGEHLKPSTPPNVVTTPRSSDIDNGVPSHVRNAQLASHSQMQDHVTSDTILKANTQERCTGPSEEDLLMLLMHHRRQRQAQDSQNQSARRKLQERNLVLQQENMKLIDSCQILSTRLEESLQQRSYQIEQHRKHRAQLANLKCTSEQINMDSAALRQQSQTFLTSLADLLSSREEILHDLRDAHQVICVSKTNHENHVKGLQAVKSSIGLFEQDLNAQRRSLVDRDAQLHCMRVEKRKLEAYVARLTNLQEKQALIDKRGIQTFIRDMGVLAATVKADVGNVKMQATIDQCWHALSGLCRQEDGNASHLKEIARMLQQLLNAVPQLQGMFRTSIEDFLGSKYFASSQQGTLVSIESMIGQLRSDIHDSAALSVQVSTLEERLAGTHSLQLFYMNDKEETLARVRMLEQREDILIKELLRAKSMTAQGCKELTESYERKVIDLTEKWTTALDSLAEAKKQLEESQIANRAIAQNTATSEQALNAQLANIQEESHRALTSARDDYERLNQQTRIEIVQMTEEHAVGMEHLQKRFVQEQEAHHQSSQRLQDVEVARQDLRTNLEEAQKEISTLTSARAYDSKLICGLQSKLKIAESNLERIPVLISTLAQTTQRVSNLERRLPIAEAREHRLREVQTECVCLRKETACLRSLLEEVQVAADAAEKLQHRHSNLEPTSTDDQLQLVEVRELSYITEEATEDFHPGSESQKKDAWTQLEGQKAASSDARSHISETSIPNTAIKQKDGNCRGLLQRQANNEIEATWLLENQEQGCGEINQEHGEDYESHDLFSDQDDPLENCFTSNTQLSARTTAVPREDSHEAASGPRIQHDRRQYRVQVHDSDLASSLNAHADMQERDHSTSSKPHVHNVCDAQSSVVCDSQCEINADLCIDSKQEHASRLSSSSLSDLTELTDPTPLASERDNSDRVLREMPTDFDLFGLQNSSPRQSVESKTKRTASTASQESMLLQTTPKLKPASRAMFIMPSLRVYEGPAPGNPSRSGTMAQRPPLRASRISHDQDQNVCTARGMKANGTMNTPITKSGERHQPNSAAKRQHEEELSVSETIPKRVRKGATGQHSKGSLGSQKRTKASSSATASVATRPTEINQAAGSSTRTMGAVSYGRASQTRARSSRAASQQDRYAARFGQ